MDGVNTSTPAIYTVHVDHLKRPIRMIAANGTWAWDVDYAPFGGTAYLYTNPAVMNGRFPGQWFQLETGLAYDWHRHYDPTLGRYIQPAPLVVDEDDAAVAGISQGTLPGGGNTGNAPALGAGWKSDADFMTAYNAVRPMLQDGSSVYGYAGQNPLTKTDLTGLASNDYIGPAGPICLLMLGDACALFKYPHEGEFCPASAAMSPRQPWSCDASCNVQQIDQKAACPDRVTGTASGPSENLACMAAKRVATQSSPRGCYARHCQCRCTKT